MKLFLASCELLTKSEIEVRAWTLTDWQRNRLETPYKYILVIYFHNEVSDWILPGLCSQETFFSSEGDTNNVCKLLGGGQSWLVESTITWARGLYPQMW